MLLRTRPMIQNLSCSLFKRYNATQSLREMLSVAENFSKEKKYMSAQNQYKKIMDTYPNYERAYKEYYFLEYMIVGPYGLTQSLWNHLQAKYLKAIEQHGEFSENEPPTFTP